MVNLCFTLELFRYSASRPSLVGGQTCTLQGHVILKERLEHTCLDDYPEAPKHGARTCDHLVRPQAGLLASTNTISLIGAPQPRVLPGSLRGPPLTNSVGSVHVSTGLSPSYTMCVSYLCYLNLVPCLYRGASGYLYVCSVRVSVTSCLRSPTIFGSRQSVSVAPPAHPAHREYRGLLCPSCACHLSHCSGHTQALCKQHAC